MPEAKSATVRTAAAAHAYADLIGPRVRELMAEGKGSKAIAAALTEEGYRTRRGKPWNHVQVRRVIARLGLAG